MTGQSAAATAFDHNSTLVLALELSGKGWQVGAVYCPSGAGHLASVLGQ